MVKLKCYNILVIHLLLSIINNITFLDSFPNTSYGVNGISEALVHKLKGIPNLAVAEDPYGVYARYQNGENCRSLIIDSHLDHPGFLHEQGNTCIPVGSIVDNNNLTVLNENLPFPVRIFDRNGVLTETASIMEFSGTSPNIKAHLDRAVAGRNGQALLDIPVSLKDGEVTMRSADNHAVTATALTLIESLAKDRIRGDVTFIFTKLEEVFQSASSIIVQNWATPFGRIADESLVIALEAGTPGANSNTHTISSEPFKSDKGPMIRVGDNGLAFTLEGQTNLAESLLLHTARDLGAAIQHTSSISYCDATPFILFGNSPHVIGLTVPCMNKHNFDLEQGIAPEIVKMRDLETVLALLTGAIIRSNDNILMQQQQILKSGRTFPGNEPAKVKSMQKQWKAVALWTKPRLDAGHFFAENLQDQIRFNLARATSAIKRS